MSLEKNNALADRFMSRNPGLIASLTLIHARQRREHKQRLADAGVPPNYDLQERLDRDFERTHITEFHGVYYIQPFHHHKPLGKWKTRGGAHLCAM